PVGTQDGNWISVLGMAVQQVKKGSTSLPTLADNGVLTVYGSGASDTITIGESGEDLLVNVSGRTQSFVTASVVRIDVLSGGGRDHVDCHATLKPVNVNAGPGNDTVLGGSGDDTL